MNKSVAILGCGPAGLFAAHAASERGAEVRIYSKARQSYMRGAQYLHQPIGSLSGAPFQINYVLEGSVAGYREKVYGKQFEHDVSPESLTGTHQAWDIREAYDAAWELYGHLVTEWDAQEDDLPRADLVISTVPARLLCEDDSHEFLSQKVWSTDWVKSSIIEPYGKDNVVVCSGDPDDWWYRASRIHGFENTEYPMASPKPKLVTLPNGRELQPVDADKGLREHIERIQEGPHRDHLWEVEKPIFTSCTCHPHIQRLGRYGAWRKGVLSHEAYVDTLDMVGAL